LLRNPSAKALYVFPLKALERDQIKSLSFLLKGLKGKKISAGVYDGDISPYRRKQIRANIPQILVTNPDMLHSAIMAYHETWKSSFRISLWLSWMKSTRTAAFSAPTRTRS